MLNDLYFLFQIWLAFVIITPLVAYFYKNRDPVEYFALALFLGPIAFLMVLFVKKNDGKENTGTRESLIIKSDQEKNELLEIKKALEKLEQRISLLEENVLEKDSSSYADNKETDTDESLQETPLMDQVDSCTEDIEQSETFLCQNDILDGLKAIGVVNEQNNNEKNMRDLSTSLSEESSNELKTESNPKKTFDFEMQFGKNWLNKIGLLIFTLGIGFLVSYSFQYFAPLLKILFSYVVSGVIFFIAFKLEKKNKYQKYAYALLGTAWALVYFTTYAMHHFEASRIIESPLLAFVALFSVSLGMAFHAFRYKSEGAMTFALMVSYVTTTLGSINSFTFLGVFLLAILAVFFISRLEWVKVFLISLLMTYGIHILWVTPNISSSMASEVLFGLQVSQYHVLLNFIFLTLYWFAYFLGIHVAKAKTKSIQDMLSVANFGNFLIYATVSYPYLSTIFGENRYYFVVCVGAFYLALAFLSKSQNKPNLFVGDLVTAFFVLTFSLPLNFDIDTTLLLWLIEIPFLLFVGFNFNEKVYRYLSYAFSYFVLFKLIYEPFYYIESMNFLESVWSFKEFLLFVSTMIYGSCYGMSRKFRDRSDQRYDMFFSGLNLVVSIVFLTYLLFVKTDGLLREIFFGLEIILLLLSGFRLKEKILINFSSILSLVGAFYFFEESYLVTASLREYCFVMGIIFILYSLCLYLLGKKDSSQLLEKGVNDFYQLLSVAYLTSYFYLLVPEHLTSILFLIEGWLFLFLRLRFSFRYVGYFANFLLIFSVYQYGTTSFYQVSDTLKWLIILMNTLGIYFTMYIYQHYAKQSGVQESLLTEQKRWSFVASMVLLFTIFKHIDSDWQSLLLGACGAMTVFLGMLMQRKFERMMGMFLLAITLLRVFFVDLSGLDIIYKIITFIFVGLFLLGVSFFYNRMSDDGK